MENMNTVALEDLTTLVILSFCENLAELGMPKNETDCDMWYRYLSDEERYKISEKLLDLIKRDMEVE